MADRRGVDNTPLAPRRPLSAATDSTSQEPRRRGLSDRVAAAVSAPGAVRNSADSGATSASGASARGRRTTPTQRSATSSGESTGTATRSSSASRQSSRPRGTRRARLRLVHLDPWSVMKTSFLLSIALGIVLVVAVAVVMSVLDAAGVWASINKTVADVLGGDAAQNFNVNDYVSTSRVLGVATVIAVVDVILLTAISTLGAFLYNLAAALLGGVEITLAEDDR